MIERATGGSAEAHEQMAASEPVGRMGTPEEIAASVVWLCSDAASFVTGVPMPVDGEMVAQVADTRYSSSSGGSSMSPTNSRATWSVSTKPKER